MNYPMSFIDAISICISKYFTISGRARRREYWYFWLFQVLLYSGSYFAFLFHIIQENDTRAHSSVLLYFIASIALYIPGLTVKIRRFHDTGHSAWNLLWYFVPLAGPIIIFVYLVSDSEPGANIYGPNPKGINYHW